jgi:Alkylmercury lyase
MTIGLPIKTAEELVDPALEARWATRRAARETEVLERILRTFVDRGGPIPVDEVVAVFRDRPPEAVHHVLHALDDDDLIRVRNGEVDLAYPFSAIPTAFVVRLADGQERYACCAIDALGIAPMLGQLVHIRSRCHHCTMAVELSVSPEGPEPDADGVMVWVGKQAEDRARIATSL